MNGVQLPVPTLPIRTHQYTKTPANTLHFPPLKLACWMLGGSGKSMIFIQLVIFYPKLLFWLNTVNCRLVKCTAINTKIIQEHCILWTISNPLPTCITVLIIQLSTSNFFSLSFFFCKNSDFSAYLKFPERYVKYKDPLVLPLTLERSYNDPMYPDKALTGVYNRNSYVGRWINAKVLVNEAFSCLITLFL